MSRVRKAYFFAAALFLALAFISKFYSGPYWRLADAYLGDVFIVGSLYFFLSMWWPRSPSWRRFSAIVLFAAAVELFQATGIPASLKLPRPFVFILGTRFDFFDLICYVIGLLLAVGVEKLLVKREKMNEKV